MMDNSSNLIGKVLGRYRLEKQIGQGGNARVFRAWQENLSRHVAVKVLSLPETGDARLHNNFLARFQQEASVIARFNHVNIMPIYDFGEQDGLTYLVMPLFDKGSLRNILSQRGSLSLQEAATYIEQAASALDYAHAHRVIHRDLKPGNFLIHNDGRLVLADFGIAHLMKERMSGFTLTNTGMVLGTPEYMAPEMIQGQQADHRVDIYELGIVLYEMLSGDVPFRGEHTYAILLKHVNDSLPSLHHLDATIPSAVDDVLQKATAKNRDERFASAGDFVKAFQEVMNPQPSMVIDSHFAPTVLPLHVIPLNIQTVYSVDAQTVANTPPKAPPPPLSTVYVPPLFNTPSVSTPNKRRVPFKRPALWLMLCLVGVIAAISVPLLATNAVDPRSKKPVTQPTPTTILTPTATLTPDEQNAITVVNDYYHAFKQRNYTTAYGMSHTDTANSDPDLYCRFVTDYAGMVDNSIKIDDVVPLNDATSVQKYGANAVRVDITITAIEEVGPSYETRVSTYQQYHIVQSGKIVSVGTRNNSKNGMIGTPTVIATSQPVTTPNSAHTLSQQVQEVVQEQYDYLNRTDYDDAYNMWSKQYQSTTSFCSFLLARVQVQHFTVQVGNVSDPGDGTEDAPVTVTETVAGTSNAPYNLVYYVAQQNDGSWEIMQTVNMN